LGFTGALFSLQANSVQVPGVVFSGPDDLSPGEHLEPSI